MAQLVGVERLQALRQLREENMLFCCDFEELSVIEDPAGTGGKIESWAVIPDLSGLPCSVVAMNGDETIAAQQIAPASNAFIYVPWRYGALLKAKYRVVVRGDIDGVSFVETYGIGYIAVPKTFSVQTTIYARSGMASSGEPRVMMALRAGAGKMGVESDSPEPTAAGALGNDRPVQPMAASSVSGMMGVNPFPRV